MKAILILMVALWLAHPALGQQVSMAEFRSELLNGTPSMAPDKERSVPLAFVMSAALPGAGQAYNRNWVKAVIGISIEAAALTAWSTMRTRGLRQEDDFRDFAHADWSPGRYALWLNDYTDYLNATFNSGIDVPRVNVPTQVDFTQPGSWTSAEETLVAQMVSEIRTIERNVFHPETGAALSHQLPTFASQQYYELIGKYFQFAPGWEDYPVWGNAEEGFTLAIDPVRSGPNGTKPNVSAKFFQYAEDHGNAQDLLRAASRVSFVFILNHLVAGIDAAVSAKLQNDRISTRMGVAYEPSGRPVAVTTVSFRF